MTGLKFARRGHRRFGAAALATLVAGSSLLLEACGTVHPGAAATVGKDRITVAQLDAVVSRSLADPTFAKATTDQARLRTSRLQNLIRDRLLTVALTEQQLAVSEGDVQAELKTVEKRNGQSAPLTDDQFYPAAARIGLSRDDVHVALFDLIAENKLETKVTTPVVHAAHILLKDKSRADAILAAVKADPSQFATLAKSESLDSGSAASGGDLGTAPAVTYVAPFADATSTAPVGSYFELQTSFGWHVVHLISRDDVTIADLASQAQSQKELNAVRAIFFASISKKIGVSVNPRYGTWSADTAEITAAPNAFSSPFAPSSAGPLTGGAPPSSGPPASAPPVQSSPAPSPSS